MKWLTRKKIELLDALVNGAKPPDIKMGLAFSSYAHGYYLVYRWHGGFGTWIPDPGRHYIVTVWNSIACCILGHDRTNLKELGGRPVIVCTMCCKEWPT